jgi:hypothetical protein
MAIRAAPERAFFCRIDRATKSMEMAGSSRGEKRSDCSPLKSALRKRHTTNSGYSS